MALFGAIRLFVLTERLFMQNWLKAQSLKPLCKSSYRSYSRDQYGISVFFRACLIFTGRILHHVRWNTPCRYTYVYLNPLFAIATNQDERHTFRHSWLTNGWVTVRSRNQLLCGGLYICTIWTEICQTLRPIMSHPKNGRSEIASWTTLGIKRTHVKYTKIDQVP